MINIQQQQQIKRITETIGQAISATDKLVDETAREMRARNVCSTRMSKTFLKKCDIYFNRPL